MKCSPGFLRNRILPFAIASGAVLLDQFTKWLAVLYLKPVSSVPLWQDVFHLTFRTNRGAAFSLFAEDGQRWIFLTVSTLTILFLIGYLLRGPVGSPLFTSALGMVLGGGIGNMIDRLTTGEVVDFFDFCLIHFPVFNVADCFVTIGAALLILSLFLDGWTTDPHTKKQKQAETESDMSSAPSSPHPEDPV